ncbi:MAG: hypothetical protein MJ252_27350 [archaeon]|nr:hypothetical protein [archaeon]
MSFFKKAGNLFDSATSKAKEVFRSDDERIDAKKALNKVVMNFILNDQVIEKMVYAIYGYTKLNLFDPLLAKLENGELDNYFDEMLLVDYFLKNENIKDYAMKQVNDNTKIIEKMISKLSSIVSNTYDKLLDSKENVFEKIEAVQKDLLDQGLKELNSAFAEIQSNTIEQTREIPKKFLLDEIENVACSFETIMMSSLALSGLVKDDYMNIAQTLLKNGAVNELGQFNPKMLEDVVVSGKELIPFVILSRLTDEPKKEEPKKKGGLFGNFDVGSAFNQAKSAVTSIGNAIQKKDLSEIGKNVTQMKDQFSMVYANIKGVKKVIESLKDIDFGKYAQFKDAIIQFCKDFYTKIEEFITKNLDVRKIFYKLIEVAILTKIFECMMKAFETKEINRIFGAKQAVIRDCLLKIQNEKIEEQKK